ncbi:MAG: hypothetical protein QF705_03505 [Arenicellales bacterium]|jgi:hypothetical protein|nr:hypothetical protein [Arenicellales bacterium]HJL66588.1 hypothetical protein [Arenicellales bacterium]
MRSSQFLRSPFSKAGPPASIGEHHFFSIVTFIADRNYEGRPEEAIMAQGLGDSWIDYDLIGDAAGPRQAAFAFYEGRKAGLAV